uniref:Uncharacterized protein n=1 Tax=Anguilla anguilla TaxID=7936 RepID=A0A0E9V0D3_ANGAN
MVYRKKISSFEIVFIKMSATSTHEHSRLRVVRRTWCVILGVIPLWIMHLICVMCF